MNNWTYLGVIRQPQDYHKLNGGNEPSYLRLAHHEPSLSLILSLLDEFGFELIF